MLSRKGLVSFAETRQFSKLFTDYVSGEEQLKKFYRHSFQPSQLGSAISERMQHETLRGVLCDALRRQYAAAGISVKNELIDRLAKENCFTVCTGHQLCLATGPLFFIYKIITTIKLAEDLRSQFPGNDFLPVYWMASEDHDFDEIASIHLFGKTLRWEQEQKGAAGKISTATLQPILAELEQLAGNSEAAVKLISLLRDAYSAKDLATATRKLVHELFASYDLLILDADDQMLKHQLIPYAWDDLTNHHAEQKVAAAAAELENAGYGVQVNPRPINLFYLRENSRERIEKDGDDYVVLGTEIRFTKDQIQSELENFPERFSPNVVLRPIYQQVILPNVAYVGGPGELAYWLEYLELFSHYAIPFPALVPRSFALITDRGSEEKLSKFGLPVSTLFEDADTLVKNFVLKNSGENLSLAAEKEETKKLFSSIAERAAQIDSTLRKSVEAEMQKQINAIESLESKLLRAEKQKQETSVNQLKKIRDKFLPGNSLQERYENFIPWYLRTDGKLVDELYSLLSSCGTELIIIGE